jgi:multiple RNA-binding domain-containing protein 1
VVYDDSIPRQPASAEDEPSEQPAVSDLDWLRSRTSRTLGLQSDSEESDNEKSAESESEDERQSTPVSSDDETEEPSNKEISSPAEVAATTEPDAPTVSAAEAKIIKTGRLFVRNLVYGITEEDLRNVFSPHGQIEEVSLPTTSCNLRT